VAVKGLFIIPRLHSELKEFADEDNEARTPFSFRLRSRRKNQEVALFAVRLDSRFSGDGDI
jgi:hypothetical protein